MLRCMYSGISGMKVNQVKLDVIGNNIANVSTTAFKGSRVRFQDMLSQNLSFPSSPSLNQGGVNPSQVGLGVKVSGVDTLIGQGNMQPTGRNLDMAMDGTGYFLVGRGKLPTTNSGGVSIDAGSHSVRNGNGMAISYTRDGALALDEQGNLLTSDGYRVLGYAVQENGGVNKDTLSVDYSKQGQCGFVDSDSKSGLKAQDTLVPLRVPDSVYMKAPEVKGALMEMASGDSTKIVTMPGITITDGGANIYKGTENLKVEVKYVPDTTTPTDSVPNIYINGVLAKVDPADPASAAAGFGVSIDLNKLKITKGNISIQVTAPALDTTTPPTGTELQKYSWSSSIDAEGAKKVRTFNIEKSGLLKAVLEDGKVSVLGQVAIASFKNPEGLQKMGKNLWSNSSNSGQPIVKSGVGSDNDNGDGYGDVLQGMLEMSNVDLAEQFTDMIVANRAFQANSKIISTGDEILQDIINLKR